MALSKVDLANMVENVAPESSIPDVSFRNLLINGDMSIAQRATSATTLGHQSYGTVDRISQNLTASSFVCTGEQSTDAPEGFDYSFKVACTTADTSLAAGDRLFLYQRVEDRNLGYLKFGTSNAVSLTLSFHVKSNKTGTYQVNLWHNNASKFVSATYTISSADTWEKKTLTFIGDTSTAMGNDSASALQVEMVLLGGTTYTSGSVSSTYTNTAANRAAGQTVNIADSTSNTWQITGMQLEVGTSASDFEFLPVDVQTQRCLRYYETSMTYGDYSQYQGQQVVFGVGGTVFGGAENVIGGRQFKVWKRATPTV